MRQQFLKDTSGTLQTYIYKNNRKIVPSSATITIYKPAQTEKLVDGASMTVSADGLLSYALTAADNKRQAYADEAYNLYKAIITYVYSGTTEQLSPIFYEVVTSKISSLLTDEDIVSELPLLKDNGWRTHGQADSGSTTTIVDAELKRYEDDYFTGGLALSLDKDETREITGFVSATGTLTTTAFGSAISTDKYILMRPFTKEIQRALETIEELLIRTGKRPYLVIDSYDLREVHLKYAVAEICKGLITMSDGTWWQLWKDYEARAYSIFKDMKFKYDEYDEGVLVPEEMKRRTGPRFIARG